MTTAQNFLRSKKLPVRPVHGLHAISETAATLCWICTVVIIGGGDNHPLNMASI